MACPGHSKKRTEAEEVLETESYYPVDSGQEDDEIEETEDTEKIDTDEELNSFVNGKRCRLLEERKGEVSEMQETYC